MKLHLIIIAIHITDALLRWLERLNRRLYEARWPGFNARVDAQVEHDNRILRNHPIGYSDVPTTPLDPPYGYEDLPRYPDEDEEYETLLELAEQAERDAEDKAEIEYYCKLYGQDDLWGQGDPNEHGVLPISPGEAGFEDNTCQSCYLDPSLEWDDPKLYHGYIEPAPNYTKINEGHVVLCAACHPEMPNPQPKQPVTIGEAFSFISEKE